MPNKMPRPNVDLPPTARPCDRLWYLVTRDGITNAELARILDVTKESARRYVIGKSDLRAWQITEICRHFKCTPNFLLGLKREVNG